MSSPSPRPTHADLQAEPDRDALASVLSSICGRGARIHAVERMTGGIDNGAHHLTLEVSNGELTELVLRRFGFLAKAPESELPQARATREWGILTALAEAGAPVTRPRWHDPSGKVFGVPALIYDYVSGRARQPADDPGGWTREAARGLVKVHSIGQELDLVGLGIDFDRTAEDICRASRPPSRWRAYPMAERLFEAIRAVGPHAVEAPRTLLHTDYWGGNTIWQGDRLQAIIDWDQARIGQRALDVAYMWMDLSIVGRRELAECFLDEYAQEAGGRPENMLLYKLVALARPLPDLHRWFPDWDDGRVARAGRAIDSLIEELAP